MNPDNYKKCKQFLISYSTDQFHQNQVICKSFMSMKNKCRNVNNNIK
jgi:hypothetical protein